jgi:hypothetical protein
MLWRPIPACLQDLGSPDLARYVRSGTGYVTYASLDRVAARRLGWHRPVCRYQEGNVSESAEVLVDKPAIQRHGALVQTPASYA